jgi:signal transduction histidine kinase
MTKLSMRLLTFWPRLLRHIASRGAGLWLAGCMLAAACLVATCIAAMVVARSEAEQRADGMASDTAAIAAHEIGGMIERFDQAILTTIGRLQSPPMTALEEPMRSLLLFDAASGLRPLGFIEALNEDGIVTESPKPAERGSRWGSSGYFTAQRANPSLGLYVSHPLGQGDYASIAFSRRMSYPDGTFAGVVAASLRLNYVHDLFSQLNVGSQGSIALLRDDGTVLMRLPVDASSMAEPGRAQRPFATRQVGQLPLSVQVTVAPQSVAGAWPRWTGAILVTGVLLASISSVLTFLLQREAHRREAAERDNRHKFEYLAMAGNELRAPLRSILWSAERLHTDAALDIIAARHLEAIESAGKHLRDVVDRVLNCLHVAARLPAPRMGRVVLEQLLDECCVILESDAVAKRLGLRYGFKAGAPEQFVTDGDMLRQILLNLLTNAIKFTERGEVTIEIGGTAERVTIEVIDTGCGIPPAQRHKLFKQEEREQTWIPGHGIGLAISQRLVQAMGGNIGFRENPAGGSIFWVGLSAGAPPELASIESHALLQMALP